MLKHIINILYIPHFCQKIISFSDILVMLFVIHANLTYIVKVVPALTFLILLASRHTGDSR